MVDDMTGTLMVSTQGKIQLVRDKIVLEVTLARKKTLQQIKR